MKRIHFSIMHMAILAIVSLFSLQILVGCIEDPSQSQKDMKQQALNAINNAGGSDALGKEAQDVLNNFRVGSDWKSISNSGTNSSAITKFQFLLAPDEGSPWVVETRNNLPSHVVVRFGSHRHYKYVLIFDPALVPDGKVEGVEHLSGAVYLSERNL